MSLVGEWDCGFSFGYGGKVVPTSVMDPRSWVLINGHPDSRAGFFGAGFIHGHWGRLFSPIFSFFLPPIMLNNPWLTMMILLYSYSDTSVIRREEESPNDRNDRGAFTSTILTSPSRSCCSGSRRSFGSSIRSVDPTRDLTVFPSPERPWARRRSCGF